jgi:sialidase-1
MINRGRSAYSDLVKLNDNRIGVLYEWGDTANYEEIRFATFTEQWLDDPTVVQLNFDEQTSGVAPSTSNYLKDSRGYGLHGTASNGPAFVEGDPRYNNGAALRFTGGIDEVRIDDISNSPLDFEDEDSFTLEAVFKTTSHSGTSANASGPLISKDIGAGLPSYFLRIQDSKVRFLVSDNSSLASLYSDVVVNDGEWHHVAAVRDGAAGTISLYVDYVFAGSVADTTTGGFGNASDLLIGSFNDSSGTTNKQFVGDIDFIRVSFGALGTDEFVQPDLIVGDLDGDGFVGIADLNIVLGNWNQNVGAGNPLLGDPSGDGFVGIEDLNTVLGNWNAGTSPGADSVPEPGAALVLTPLAGLWLSKRKR